MRVHAALANANMSNKSWRITPLALGERPMKTTEGGGLWIVGHLTNLFIVYRTPYEDSKRKRPPPSGLWIVGYLTNLFIVYSHALTYWKHNVWCVAVRIGVFR